jgi:hypothetical protein
MAEPSNRQRDTIRSFGGKQTPLSQEATLFGITNLLNWHDIEFIVLRRATEKYLGRAAIITGAGTMTKQKGTLEDTIKQAKAGQYLVIGTDAFHDRKKTYVIVEYATFEKAKRLARADERLGTMTYISIYDWASIHAHRNCYLCN